DESLGMSWNRRAARSRRWPMILRRKTGLIVASLMVLASLWGHAFRTLRGQQNSTTATAETRGSDWSVLVRLHSAIVIAHKGVPVINSAMMFWGRNWRFAPWSTKRTEFTEGHQQFSGENKDLKLKVINDLKSPAPNIIRMELVVRAEQDLPGVIGGGWQWNL